MKTKGLQTKWHRCTTRGSSNQVVKIANSNLHLNTLNSFIIRKTVIMHLCYAYYWQIMEKVKITFHLNLKNYPQNKSKVVNFTCCKLLQNTTKSVIY